MRKFFLLLCLVCAVQGMSAQTDIHDKYSSKSEACEDGTYRKSDGYKKFGQIGWEKESGWRKIQYLDRYESEHRKFNTNSFLYCQVMWNDILLDDCEIVAFDTKGNVVGNQCPEPFPQKAGDLHHVAIMAIFGDTPNEKITLKIIKGAGTADDPVKEGQAEEIHLFVPNGTTGLVDTDYDGRLDTWSPVVLHVKDTPTVIREVSTGEVKGDKVQVVYTLTGQRVHMDAVARGTIVLVNGKKIVVK